MPLITLDTSVALPGALKPASLPRKLWVVLAYGVVTYRAEHLRLDRDELLALVEQEGGEVHGATALDAMISDAEARQAVLGKLLPDGTPRDYVAVGSAPLFDEFERKVREIGNKFDPQIRPADATTIRRQFEAICGVGAPPFPPARVPALTRDPQDDPIVFGALLAGVDLLISDDKDIVPNRREHEYEHGEHRLRATTFGHFIREVFEPSDFRWREIDGSWLREALRRFVKRYARSQ